MRREDFENQLLAASFRALVFAQRFVRNRLSPNLTWIAVLNQSNDDDKAPDEEVYPEDAGSIEVCDSPAVVVDLLFRNEACPQWIDISVVGSDRDMTLVRLVCCGRFQKNEERLYYHKWGTQPFGIKGPPVFEGDKPGKKRSLPGVESAAKAVRARETPMRILDRIRQAIRVRWMMYNHAVAEELKKRAEKC